MSTVSKIILATSTLLLSYSMGVLADGNSISHVKHPYIQAQEKEISFSSFYQSDSQSPKDKILKHKLGIGWALSDQWFAEINISGKKQVDESLAESSYEIELKHQLTEQGEYAADYGVLIGYEHKDDINIEEVFVSLITEKQWGKWVATTNLTGIYEWGNDIKNEFETALAAQARYRYKPSLEPAIELYAGEFNKGIGPVLTGFKRLSPGKKLFWEMGIIIGIDKDSPDRTYRALLEYEF
jgi:hypothetical protein